MELKHAAGRLAAAVIVLMLITACTIRYSESQKLNDNVASVKEVQVVFVGAAPAKTEVVTTGSRAYLSSLHDVNVKYLAPREQRRVQELLTVGFRDRFPVIAASYGLAVRPTAPAQLRLRVVDEKIIDGGTIIQILLEGELIAPSGRTVWRFETSAKNRSVFAKFDETVVDRISVELLEKMRKDGLIGG